MGCLIQKRGPRKDARTGFACDEARAWSLGVEGEMELVHKPNDDRSAHRQWLANAAWLLLLRWVAVIGQLITIACAHWVLKVDLPLFALFSVIGLTGLSNLLMLVLIRQADAAAPALHKTPLGDTLLASVMVFDIISLTALLYFAGGLQNPFSIFYLVNLTLGAVILSERWGWVLTTLAVLGMIGLLCQHVPVPSLQSMMPGWLGRQTPPATFQSFGHVVAMATCALVIIHFVSRVTRQLESTAAELRRVERERSRSEKLEALGTLAGGAAHELATPLSTIAVVSKEMLRFLSECDVPDTVRDDMSLIRQEVDHCQTILQRMTGRAGRSMAEQQVETNLHALMQYTLAELAQGSRVDFDCDEAAKQIPLVVPRESLAQAIRGLIQNALDATTPQQSVRMTVTWDDRTIQVVVQDEGTGMSSDVLKRAGEPFFTTKEPGRGMGLGVFLTRSVIERLGGRLHLSSSPGQGVTAVVELPRQEGLRSRGNEVSA